MARVPAGQRRSAVCYTVAEANGHRAEENSRLPGLDTASGVTATLRDVPG